MKDMSINSWEGKLPLWQAYWLIFFPINVIFGLTMKALSDSTNIYFSIANILFVLLYFVFLSLITKIIFRCSKNVKYQIWASITKGIFIILWISVAGRFIVDVIQILK